MSNPFEEAKKKDGFYWAIVPGEIGHVPIISKGGKLFSMKIDSELGDEGWNPSVEFTGPLEPPDLRL